MRYRDHMAKTDHPRALADAADQCDKADDAARDARKERNRRIVAARRDGLPQRETARAARVSVEHVRQLDRENDIPITKPKRPAK